MSVNGIPCKGPGYLDLDTFISDHWEDRIDNDNVIPSPHSTPMTPSACSYGNRGSFTVSDTINYSRFNLIILYTQCMYIYIYIYMCVLEGFSGHPLV